MSSADSDRFARLDALFQGALERPPEEREAWLDRECADDRGLRREIDELLAEDAGGSYEQLAKIVDSGWSDVAELDSPPSTIAFEDQARQDLAAEDQPTRRQDSGLPFQLPASVEQDPGQIGPYHILGRLGRGGMATVYLAEREGEFSMNVALKRIRKGMDTDDIVERLRLERQILARLIHPNICRIHDGGSDDDGRPYLVMEVIEGSRIDAWCVEQKLPLRQRLELFAEVCEAVDYAHQNLVLHRDLKPSNIMVTTDGVPKLLDFGIAKLLRGENEDPGAMPTLTRLEERMLTPEYASPEQLLGLPLNTASDVYSLGVVLYQLTGGFLPHKPEGTTPPNPLIWALARQDQDAKPLSEVARRSREKGRPLVPELDRFTSTHAAELDAVLAKALEPKPERRYGSVRELVEDLRRLLDGRPVLARHQTWAYRTWKLIRRHRTGVAVAALVASSMTAAVIGTSWQASVAQKERLRAEAEKQQAEAASGFLADLFAVSDPYAGSGLLGDPNDGFRPLSQEVTARDLLDAGARRIRGDLRESPLARAEVQRTIAKAYFNLFLFEEARGLLESAQRDALAMDGRNPEVALVRAALTRDLGALETREGNFDEAERLLRDAELQFRDLGDEGRSELPATLEQLGDLELQRHHFPQAEELFAQAVELQVQLHGERSIETAHARAGLARIFRQQRRFEEAIELFRSVLEDRAAILGENHPLVLETTNDLAVATLELDPTAGRRTFERLLEKQRRALGPRHADLVSTLYNLAAVLRAQGIYSRATEHLNEAAELASEYLPVSPVMARILMMRALIHTHRDLNNRAVADYRRALDIRRQIYPEQHPEIVHILTRLGGLLATMGESDAEIYLEEALEINRLAGLTFGPAIRMSLADSALRAKRWSDVVEQTETGLTELAETGQEESYLSGVLERRRAEALWRLGRKNDAAASADRAVRRLSDHFPPSHSWVQEAKELRGRIRG